MRRRLYATVGICVLAAIVAASARGDGGPGPGVVQGWDGIARGPVQVRPSSADETSSTVPEAGEVSRSHAT